MVCIIFCMAVRGRSWPSIGEISAVEKKIIPLANIQKTIENGHLWRVFP
jgi:hypothetical protein